MPSKTSNPATPRSDTRWLVASAALSLLLGLALAVGWLVTGGPSEPSTPPGPAAGAPDTSPHPGPLTPTPAAPIEPIDILEPPPAPLTDAAPVTAEWSGMESLLAFTASPPERSARGVIVVDTRSRPVADARVELWPRADAARTAAGTPSLVRYTDAAGRAVLSWTEPDGVLVAQHDDAGTSGLWTWSALERRQDADGLTVITLRPVAMLAVTVLHFDDRPAPGARVVFAPDGAPSGAGLPRVPLDAVTDEYGRVTLAVDAPARLVAVAELGSLVSPEVRVSVPTAETTATQVPGPDGTGAEPDAVDLVLRLPGPWSISGVLRDPRGEPVPGGTISLWRHFPDHDVLAGLYPDEPPYQATTIADDDGAFRFDLPRLDTYTLIGTAPDAPPGEPVVAQVTSFQRHVTVHLFTTDTSHIAGRLLDATGTPLVGVTVRARPAHLYRPEALEYAPTVWGRLGQAAADTDEQGRFVLAPLHPAGSYILFARPDESHPERKIVVKDVPAGSEDVLLVASEENLARVVVELAVVSDATGDPIEEFRPTLLIRLDGRTIDTRHPPVHATGGVFAIEGLAPGYEYCLRVDADGFGAVESPWWTADPRGHEFLARLPATGGLDLHVTDSAGIPVTLAAVTLQRQSELFDVDRPVQGHTDDTGHAAFDPLVPGRYRIEVRHDGRQLEVLQTVAPAEFTPLALRLLR